VAKGSERLRKLKWFNEICNHRGLQGNQKAICWEPPKNVAERPFDQVELGAGRVSSNQLFWEGVQEVFEGQYQAYDNLHFADDEVFTDIHHINFGKVVPHSWKELCAIWKSFNVEYKAVPNHFTLSRMLSSNFYEF